MFKKKLEEFDRRRSLNNNIVINNVDRESESDQFEPKDFDSRLKSIKIEMKKQLSKESQKSQKSHKS